MGKRWVMLDRKTFAQYMMALYAALGHKSGIDKIEDYVMDLWYTSLSDLTDEEFHISIMYHIRNSKWYPSIAEIREVVKRLNNKNSAEKEWSAVLKAINSHGRRQYPDFKDICTCAAIESLGWTALCDCNVSELGNYRARFIKSYNEFSHENEFREETDKIVGVIDSLKKREIPKKLRIKEVK
jgi:hypothetical protein